MVNKVALLYIVKCWFDFDSLQPMLLKNQHYYYTYIILYCICSKRYNLNFNDCEKEDN